MASTTSPLHREGPARDHTGPTRYALTLAWDDGGARSLYRYPTSFATAAEAVKAGDRLVASRDYDAYALTETDAFYTTAAPTVTVRVSERAA